MFKFLSYDQLKEIYEEQSLPKDLIADAIMLRLQEYESPNKEIDDIIMPRNIRGIEFEYSSKRNEGILHWLGTYHGTRSWENPCDLGLVEIHGSSLDKGESKLLLDPNPFELWTEDIPASWFYIDLGQYSVLPYAYSLRHGGNYIADSLRNWDFQGSEDGQHWIVLKRHRNDESLKGKYDQKCWKLEKSNVPFSKFRILQTGRNSSNRHFLVISGFELYGELWCNSKILKYKV